MNRPDDEEGGPRRRGIQSVEIGLGVLDALVALGGPAPLGAVAQASGMSASQAHRYLASLIAAGMARQDAATGRYDLGPAALRLGLGALARIDAFRIADEALADYVERTGRTVQVAALGPQGPTVVRWFMGRPPVMTSFGIGAVLPLLFSATGHVFLAFVPPAEIEALVDAERARTPMPPPFVEAIRAEVRAAGRASVAGTMIPGLRAAAFPILDLQGRAILSATVLTPAGIEVRDEAASTAELGRLCAGLSAQLGWSAASATAASSGGR